MILTKLPDQYESRLCANAANGFAFGMRPPSAERSGATLAALLTFLPPVTSMSPRILFVEDDLELAGLIGEFLTRNGFVLHHIDCGDLVRRLPSTTRICCCWTSCCPAKMACPSAATCARLHPPHYLADFGGQRDMNQVLGLELGANDYVIKTTPPVVLLARIRAQLRQHEAQGGPALARPLLPRRPISCTLAAWWWMPPTATSNWTATA